MLKYLVLVLFSVCLAFAEPKPSEIVTAMQHKEFSKALIMLDEVIQKHPNNAKAYYLRSEASYSLKGYEQSKKDLDKAKALDSNFYLKNGKYSFDTNTNVQKLEQEIALHIQTKPKPVQTTQSSSQSSSQNVLPQTQPISNKNIIVKKEESHFLKYLMITLFIIAIIVGIYYLIQYNNYKSKLVELDKRIKNLFLNVNQYVEELSTSILQLEFDIMSQPNASGLSVNKQNLENKKSTAINLSSELNNLHVLGIKFNEKNILEGIESKVLRVENSFYNLKNDVQRIAENTRDYYSNNHITPGRSPDINYNTYNQNSSYGSSGGGSDFLMGMMFANIFSGGHSNTTVVNNYGSSHSNYDSSPNYGSGSNSSYNTVNTPDDNWQPTVESVPEQQDNWGSNSDSSSNDSWNSSDSSNDSWSSSDSSDSW